VHSSIKTNNRYLCFIAREGLRAAPVQGASWIIYRMTTTTVAGSSYWKAVPGYERALATLPLQRGMGNQTGL
jgi:hypothetical protein